MKIGLIDVDGHKFPNLALMKIASFHKQRGDFVEWVNHFEEYDKVYLSKIFTFSPEPQVYIHSPEIIKGGTGYDIYSKLPPEIEAIRNPDYTIYPTYDYSIQFFSRGCIRACPFCVVRRKEGKISPSQPLELNPRGKHIEVLDNNFFANPEWKSAVDFLLKQKQHISLHGVDVRIMNEEQAYWLSKLRLKSGKIHIAWDNPKDDIIPPIKEMIKHIQPYKITCYVLVGFWSTLEQDYERVIKLHELGLKPYVMPYRDFNNTRTPAQYEKDLASWVNGRERLNSCDFKDFSPRKGFKCGDYFKNKDL